MKIPSFFALFTALVLTTTGAVAQVRRAPVRPFRAAAAMPVFSPGRTLLRPPVRAPQRNVAVRRVPVLRASMMRVSPVVSVLQRMETTLTYTRFSADNRIDPFLGLYEMDAPGLVTWVLRRATPAAHRAIFERVRARSPTARDYHDILSITAPESAVGNAWQRIAQVGALRPGDVIAWRRPTSMHGAAGGTHVAFVVATPVRTTLAGGGWLVRVTDSTAVAHDNDNRNPQGSHRSGLGTGTILITSNAHNDAPTGYGWAGTRTSVVTTTSIALGRPLR
jgi:hypothetical protein